MSVLKAPSLVSKSELERRDCASCDGFRRTVGASPAYPSVAGPDVGRREPILDQLEERVERERVR
jgi:hypothetical protein